MFDLIFNKDDSFFFLKKIASTRGAPQEIDTKFRFAIHPQGIRQLHGLRLSIKPLALPVVLSIIGQLEYRSTMQRYTRKK